MGFWSNLFGGSKSAGNSGTSERKKKSDEDEDLENRSRKATDYFNSSRISEEHIDAINNQRINPNDPNSPLKYGLHTDDPRSVYADTAKMEQYKTDAFNRRKVVKDAYTGETLYRNQREAVEQTGEDWPKHAPETDHKVSVDEAYNNLKDDPWVGKDDAKGRINSKKNFQILSKSNNAAKKNLSGEEFAQKLRDQNRIRKRTQKRITKDNKATHDEFYSDINAIRIKNIATAFHDAGCDAAVNSAGTTALTGVISCITAAAQGKKVTEKELMQVAANTAKSATSSYATTGALTVLNRTLAKSGNEVLKMLGNSNAAGKALMAVQVAGDSVMKLLNHKISVGEATERIAKNASQVAIVGEAAAIGQGLIPIPVVGAAVGSLCGMVICKGLMGFFDEETQRAHRKDERQQIKDKYQLVSELLDHYTRQYEECAKEYNLRKAEFYGDQLRSIENAYAREDYASITKSCQNISTALTGNKDGQFETLDDLCDFLNS